MLPCEMEQDCLDFSHAVFMAALCSNQLIHVPIPATVGFLIWDVGRESGQLI